jgi:membrane protein
VDHAGSVLAVLVWIAASAGSPSTWPTFGSYNKTYGSLGGAVIALIWLWISNIAVLLGQELNAELERERELQAGITAPTRRSSSSRATRRRAEAGQERPRPRSTRNTADE